MSDIKKFISLENLGVYDEQIKEYIGKEDQSVADGINSKIGDITELDTTAKSDLVAAINEVRDAVGAGGTAAIVTMETSPTTPGSLKSYTLKQGSGENAITIGTIDIPKDLVVKGGKVVVNPAGQTEGTYIELELDNVAEPLYINVGTLVDIYTHQENAAQVQITVDSSTRKISATIVAGSIGTEELAANSITTAKIANGNVTLDKLDNDTKNKIHNHENSSVLNGITSTKVTVWDNAQANAEAKAADLDDDVKEELIGTATDAATADTINGAKKYTDEAMAKFVECTTADIEALFPAT